MHLPGARGPGASPLRVGIDAGPLLGPRTGVGHTTAALIEGLATRDDLELAAYAVTWTGRDRLASILPMGVAARTRPVPARAVRALWRRLDHPRIERWTGPVDVVHGTNFVGPPGRAREIITVHDLTCVRFPELCTPDTLEYPNLIRRSLDRGAVVHVVSDAVGAEVRDAFSLHEDRVVRIYPGPLGPGPGDATKGRGFAGTDRYVLALGTVEPRKNLDALVRAFDALAASDTELGLVIAGGDGWSAGAVHAAVAAAWTRSRITMTGYVDDATRADLLAGATAFAYPSRYEGFGHPPLEAMQAGVPVLATTAGSLPEVLGDAAVLVDPHDDDALTAGLARVVGDATERAVLIARGHERLARYSWVDTIEEMAALYRRVAR